MDVLIKHFVSNYKNIVIGKFYNFSRKSIWKYLLVSILITIVDPDLLGGFTKTLISIFISLIGLSLTAMLVGAKILEKRL